MKKADVIRILGVPKNNIEYGKKHLKVLDNSGRLVMILSKGAKKVDGPLLSAAKKALLMNGLTGSFGATYN